MTDPLAAPVAVSRYFEAIDAGDTDGASGCFTENAVIAVPPGDSETAARIERHGREQFRKVMSGRGTAAWSHRLVDHHSSGSMSVVEGELVSNKGGGRLSRFVVVVRLDHDGTMGSFRSFRTSSGPAMVSDFAGPGERMLQLLRDAVEPDMDSAWLDEAARSGAAVTVPSQALPEGDREPEVDVVIVDDGFAAAHGSLGTTEFCVLARRAVGEHAVGQLTGFWCSAGGSRADERGTT